MEVLSKFLQSLLPKYENAAWIWLGLVILLFAGYYLPIGGNDAVFSDVNNWRWNQFSFSCDPGLPACDDQGSIADTQVRIAVYLQNVQADFLDSQVMLQVRNKSNEAWATPMTFQMFVCETTSACDKNSPNILIFRQDGNDTWVPSNVMTIDSLLGYEEKVQLFRVHFDQTPEKQDQEYTIYLRHLESTEEQKIQLTNKLTLKWDPITVFHLWLSENLLVPPAANVVLFILSLLLLGLEDQSANFSYFLFHCYCLSFNEKNIGQWFRKWFCPSPDDQSHASERGLWLKKIFFVLFSIPVFIVIFARLLPEVISWHIAVLLGFMILFGVGRGWLWARFLPPTTKSKDSSSQPASSGDTK